jgi:hypothetical protein
VSVPLLPQSLPFFRPGREKDRAMAQLTEDAQRLKARPRKHMDCPSFVLFPA